MTAHEQVLRHLVACYDGAMDGVTSRGLRLDACQDESFTSPGHGYPHSDLRWTDNVTNQIQLSDLRAEPG